MAMPQKTLRKSSFQKTLKDDSGESSLRIGELLKKQGQIVPIQLEGAKKYVKQNGGLLSVALIRTGAIDENDIPEILLRQNYPTVAIDGREIDPKLIKMLPLNEAEKYMAITVEMEGNTLLVAMVDPLYTAAIDRIQMVTNMAIKAAAAPLTQIVNAFKKYYDIPDEKYNQLLGIDAENDKDSSEQATEVVDDLGSLVSEAAETMGFEAITEDEQDDQFSASDAPIIKLVNSIFFKAINEGASDIHIEPFEKAFYVRYRKDGTLYRSMNLPMNLRSAMISRIKILATLNITERRIPQDGRIKLKLGKGKDIDFRVSTLPTLFGESIVMRILDKSALNVDLTKIGFAPQDYEKFLRAIRRPYGLILVTGPTGSGKTTTLYSALNSLNTIDVKILTAEDPVEFNFKGINQVNVRDEVGMTFAAALKSFLRQDPDIIMVGEIRDHGTAEIAIKAAMTGHLVFSTLHTNDCVSTISRLIDIGIPPYMVASSVTLIMAQRLGRKICSNCKEPLKKISPKVLTEAGFHREEFKTLKLYQGAGCEKCSGGGLKGRIGVFEVMEVTEPIAEAITSNVPESQLRKIALKEGMLTLRQDALRKAKNGEMTVEEVLKRTVMQKETLPAYLLNPDEKTFEDGDLVIMDGNKDNNFYKLIQGCLVVSKDDKILGEITKPGEYFGEMAGLLEQPRTATIKSKGKSIVRVFPGNKLKETLVNYPEIAGELITTIVSRLKETNERIVTLTSKN